MKNLVNLTLKPRLALEHLETEENQENIEMSETSSENDEVKNSQRNKKETVEDEIEDYWGLQRAYEKLQKQLEKT